MVQYLFKVRYSTQLFSGAEVVLIMGSILVFHQSQFMVTIANIFEGFNSVLSFRPMVTVLKKMIDEGMPGAKRLYKGLIAEMESRPELLQPISNAADIEKDMELIETLLSTIFPPSTTSNQGMYAVSVPFQSDIIYASPSFSSQFLNSDGQGIAFTDPQAKEEISKSAIALAHNLILKKFYNQPGSTISVSVHPFKDQNGLTRYFEIRLNAQFVDVSLVKEKNLPKDFTGEQAMDPEEMKERFPLEDFLFEGLVVMEVSDVTQEQVIVEIKTSLLNINTFSDVAVYEELQQHVQSLVGLKNIQIGITPFFKMNGFYLHTETLAKNSLLFKTEEAISNKDDISNNCQEAFAGSSQPMLYEILNEASTLHQPLLRFYFEQGAKSLFLCPLKKEDGTLIGLLEVMSMKAGQLQLTHLTNIQPAVPLFTLALEKNEESLELQIDKTIKEHFTAIQPAVEWKFTEAAFHYLQHRQLSELAKMPAIGFDNVYPLYAAIDIRNSSTERNHSIQLDMLEQLNMAKDVLEKAARIAKFPLLNETQFRIEKYITSVSDTLLSEEELVIYDFLQNDLDAMFQNLRHSKPELRKWIDEYVSALDPQRKVIYHHRRDYEESITRINDVLDRFIDSEQHEAQEVYPHYFERYVTDGIEFNIYVGQSLSPHRPFNEMYVRNLKLWQLTLLVRAARITNTLEQRLSMPLRTTQLILAHSIPLSVSFRRKERKFDVDGAYNIRYEIVKKRIDKVHLKDSDERLTQPGTVAIVYSQHKELEEYLQFIDFLQGEKLLGSNIEHLELEDTQGISGLKAVRVNIDFESEQPAKTEGTRIATKQLLRR